MHSPTPAEKKIILASLPKPPEGKVWKQYVGDQKVKAGGKIVSFHTAIQTVGFVGPIAEGCWFTTQKASGLRSWESAWRLVAARKPSPVKTEYYRHVGSRWTVKSTETTYHEYNNNGYRGGYVEKPLAESAMYTVEEDFKAGRAIKISRAEFLATIKSYGLNEDGTKIVAPPKVRYFTHSRHFDDNSAYIRCDVATQKTVCVLKDGSDGNKGVSLSLCEAWAKEGVWKEITESEAKALLTPLKTEVERLKEELSATKTELAELATKYRDLRTKVEKARVMLS